MSLISSLILARIPGVRDMCHSLGRHDAKAGAFCTVDRQPIAVNPDAGETVARPGEHAMCVALVVLPLNISPLPPVLYPERKSGKPTCVLLINYCSVDLHLNTRRLRRREGWEARAQP